MTGYGKSTAFVTGKKFTVEIKSLNSKQFDLNLKLPSGMKAGEPRFRKLLAEKLERGKIETLLTCEVTGVESAPSINRTLALSYLEQLKALQEESGVKGDLFNAVFRFPDVLQTTEEELTDEEWDTVHQAMEEAVTNINNFRSQEGAELVADLRLRLGSIKEKLTEVPGYEEERRQRVIDKLKRSLEQWQEQYDDNRLEQEMIYYLEKLDITEEKVRLESHLGYFEQLLQEGGAIGKKLNFVSQEIGREINTLGSKANHAALQKKVVEMKDDLEKIKEQVLNLL